MSQYKDVLPGLAAQGAKLRRTRKGWMVFCPSGAVVVFHNTESDYRSIRNTRAAVRRAGLQWPLDQPRRGRR